MSDRPDEEFDKIVEGLDLDFDLTADDPPAPDLEPQRPAPTPEVDERSELHDWQVHAPPARWDLPKVLGWVAVAGGPALLVIATLAGVLLPRPVAFAAVTAAVAGAIYLVSRLPEHGPGRPDWPDDGAVL